MKKFLKVIAIIVAVILVLAIVFIVKFLNDLKIQREDQAAMVKTDEELLGQHLYIKRDGKTDVDVNFYPIGVKAPLVVQLHGGAFVAGDADTLDTLSDRISKSWGVNVVTVNYALLSKDTDKEFAIEEVKDTVRYFVDNCDGYLIDTDNIFIMGYSAGGYYAMAATLELIDEGVDIQGEILCYAFLDGILDKYEALNVADRGKIPDSLFIYAGDEPIGGSSKKYAEALRANGVPVTEKTYDTEHGFIEENNPEYENLHEKNKAHKSEKNEKAAREAEDYVKDWLQTCMAN